MISFKEQKNGTAIYYKDGIVMCIIDPDFSGLKNKEKPIEYLKRIFE